MVHGPPCHSCLERAVLIFIICRGKNELKRFFKEMITAGRKNLWEAFFEGGCS